MRLLLLRPWRLGPWLLLRRPGVALALAAAAFVAAMPAAAAPLFLSSARNATLHHQIATVCPWYVGAQISSDLPFADPPAGFDGQVPPPAEIRAERLALAAAASARVPGLQPGLSSTYAEMNAHPAGTDPDDDTLITLVTRDSFATHVQPLRGPEGTGVWISDGYAAKDHLDIGDEILIEPSTPGTAAARLRVAAIYSDLRGHPDDPWWCTMKYVYRGFPGQEFTNKPVPMMVLTDPAGFLAGAAPPQVRATDTIEYQVRDPQLPYPDAVRLAASIDRMRAELLTADPPVFRENIVADTHVDTLLGRYAGRAQLVRTSLLPPVAPITAAGVLVGLLVTASAALFWVARRRTELAVLAAHGVSPAGLGGKAVLEALPALLLGAAAGWTTAYLLVRTVGPSRVLSAEAVPQSLLAAGSALVAAVAVIGVAAGWACRALTDQVPAHRRLRLARLPWELLLLAAAYPVWQWLGEGGELTASPESGFGGVARVPGRLLVVPILVVAGVTALSVRIAAAWLRSRSSRRPPPGRSPALFLARRRTVREATVAAVLAGATAVPIALAAYGGVVTDSVRATLAAEARVQIGADVVATLSRPAEIPPALAGRATPVLRLDGALIDGVRTDVLAVDPATFAQAAYWDDRLSDGQSLADLVAQVSVDGDQVSTVGSPPAPAGTQQVTWFGAPLGGYPQVEINPAARLPAQQGGYPVLLAPVELLGADAGRARFQLWIRGDPAEIRRQLTAAQLPVTQFLAADQIYANTLLEPLTYTFDYLTALSVLTGLIGAVGLLLYLEGRAPRHRRAYALLRRMGLRPGAHRWALLAELAAPLAAGLVGGLLLAAALAFALRARIEVNESTPPGTVLTAPVGTLAATAGIVVLLALLGAGYAHRRVSRANPAEILRETT